MFCSKILVAYDGSIPAQKALDKALELASLDSAMAIDIVHIINMNQSAHTAMNSIPGIENIFYQEGELIMQDAKNKVGNSSTKCTFKLLTGPPATAILHYAVKNACDFIIMGSRGLGGLKEFLGSVSHTVVHEAKVPVLIIKG